MCSSAVKNEVFQLIFELMTLVLGSAAEEMLPKFAGIGIPVLLAAVQYSAVDRPLGASLLFAFMAGVFEDAICSLPFGASVSYFLFLSVLVRFADLPRTAALLIYPAYQMYLLVWVPSLQGNIFIRLLASIPVGVLTVFFVVVLLTFLEKKFALNEES